MQPVGWIAVGAAACLAMVMAYQSFAPASGSTPMAAAGSAALGSTGDLALAWAVARATDLPVMGQPGTDEAASTSPASDDATSRLADGVVPEGAVSDIALQAKATGESIATDALTASDDLSRTDPMEEFTEPVAPVGCW